MRDFVTGTAVVPRHERYNVDLELSLSMTATDQSTTWVFSHDDIVKLPRINWSCDLGGGWGKTSSYKMTLASSLDWIKSNISQIVGAETTLNVTLNNSDSYVPHVGKVREIKRPTDNLHIFEITVFDKFFDSKPTVPSDDLEVLEPTGSYVPHPEVLNWGTPLHYGGCSEDRPYFFVPTNSAGIVGNNGWVGPVTVSSTTTASLDNFTNVTCQTAINTWNNLHLKLIYQYGDDPIKDRLMMPYNVVQGSSTNYQGGSFPIASDVFPFNPFGGLYFWGLAPFTVMEGNAFSGFHRGENRSRRIGGIVNRIEKTDDFKLSDQFSSNTNSSWPISRSDRLKGSSVFTVGYEILPSETLPIRSLWGFEFTAGVYDQTSTGHSTSYFNFTQADPEGALSFVCSYGPITFVSSQKNETWGSGFPISVPQVDTHSPFSSDYPERSYYLTGVTSFPTTVNTAILYAKFDNVYASLKSEAFKGWSVYATTSVNSFLANQNPLLLVKTLLEDHGSVTVNSYYEQRTFTSIANRYSSNSYYGVYGYNAIYGPKIPLVDEVNTMLKHVKATGWVADNGLVKIKDYDRDVFGTYEQLYTVTPDDYMSFEIIDNPLGVTQYQSQRASEINLLYNYSYTRKKHLDRFVDNKANNSFCDSAYTAGILDNIEIQDKYIVDSETASNVLDSYTRLYTQALTFVNMRLPAYRFNIEIADMLYLQHPMIVGSQDLFFTTNVTQDYQNGYVDITAVKAPILFTNSLVNEG